MPPRLATIPTPSEARGLGLTRLLARLVPLLSLTLVACRPAERGEDEVVVRDVVAPEPAARTGPAVVPAPAVPDFAELAARMSPTVVSVVSALRVSQPPGAADEEAAEAGASSMAICTAGKASTVAMLRWSSVWLLCWWCELD